MRISSFLVLLCLLLASPGSYGAAAVEADDSGKPHTTIAYPMAEYPRLLQEAQEAGKTVEFEIPFSFLEEPPAAQNVLCPDASTSRIFIKRSYEQYAAECAVNNKPTRLVVACGHSAYTDSSCPGHSEDYFTINLYEGRKPDILGDALRTEAQAFQPNSWDFITFEGFPWDGYFNDKHLSRIKNSLRPNGAWVLLCDLHIFPSVIRIGDQDFEGGAPLADCAHNKGKIMRSICVESKKMLDEDTVLFRDHADVRTTVNSYFTKRGFRNAEVQALPAFFQSGEPLIPFLTGEVVSTDKGAPSFGRDFDVLAGKELLDIMNKMEMEFAFIMRG